MQPLARDNKGRHVFVVGMGEKGVLCDPGPEVRLVRSRINNAKNLNGPGTHKQMNGYEMFLHHSGMPWIGDDLAISFVFPSGNIATAPNPATVFCPQ